MNSKIIREKEEFFLDYARELFRPDHSDNLNCCYQPGLFSGQRGGRFKS
jgi:hypothetical protein